jgi:hypothetical protein
MSRASLIRAVRRSAALGCALICSAATAYAQEQPRVTEFLQRFVALMQEGDLEAARTSFDAEALPRIENKALILLHHAIERVADPELHFVHREAGSPGQGYGDETWAYQLLEPESSILLIIKIRTRDGQPGIAHIEWQPAPLDLRERFPFTLSGIPLPLYLVLVAAVAAPLLCALALLSCWRRRPRAWGLWTLFIPLGLGKLSVWWLPSPFHASYVRLTTFSIQPFGVGLEKSPSYDPWTLSVSLPLGALLFLLSRRWMRDSGDGATLARGGPDSSSAPGPTGP